MHFNMKKPCSNCPFRRDVDGYLSAGRADEIAEAMLHGNTTFTCHKTLDWYGNDVDGDDEVEEIATATAENNANGDEAADEDTWEEEDSRARHADKTEHCAGALIFSIKHQGDIRCANAMLQIAERLGLYDPTSLDEAAFPKVFDSKEEMVDHHAFSWPNRRHRQEEVTSTTTE